MKEENIKASNSSSSFDSTDTNSSFDNNSTSTLPPMSSIKYNKIKHNIYVHDVYDDVDDDISDTTVEVNDASADISATNLARAIELIEKVEIFTDFILDKAERFNAEKSAAQHKDEKRYEQFTQLINDGLESLRPAGGTELDKYRKFIAEINPDKGIEPERIKEFAHTLDRNVQLENRGVKETAKKVVYSAAKFGASFFVQKDDITEYKKLSKSEKEKIELIQQCVDFEKRNENNVIKQVRHDVYVNFNHRFEALEAKRLAREEREFAHIISNKIATNSSISKATFKKIKHPFAKIMANEKLGSVEKAAALVAKPVIKVAKGVKHVTGMAVDTARLLTKHSIKQPAAVIYRAATLSSDLARYTAIQGEIALYSDTMNQAIQVGVAMNSVSQGEVLKNDKKDDSYARAVKRAQLSEEAAIISKNIIYESEKLARAVLATAAIAGVGMAVVTTGGAHSITAVAGMKTIESVKISLEAKHALEILAETSHQLHLAQSSFEIVKQNIITLEEHERRIINTSTISESSEESKKIEQESRKNREALRKEIELGKELRHIAALSFLNTPESPSPFNIEEKIVSTKVSKPVSVTTKPLTVRSGENLDEISVHQEPQMGVREPSDRKFGDYGQLSAQSKQTLDQVVNTIQTVNKEAKVDGSKTSVKAVINTGRG